MDLLTAPFVSVIIPVSNDQAHLNGCLEAVEKQVYPADRYEIVVVDNGSSPPISVDAAGGTQVNLVFESRPGSYAARNRGIECAQGEILAFTDADCVPDQGWIASGLARLAETPDCGLVGGHIDVVARDPEGPNWIERYQLFTAFPQQRYVEDLNFAATANLFTYSRVFETVGVFDAGLKSTGDLEWGRRVHSYGFALAYAPDARVQHEARSTLGSLFIKATRTAGGFYDKTWSKRSRLRQVGGAIWAFRFPLVRLVQLGRRSRAQNPYRYCQSTFLTLFVHYVSAVERARLTVGGTSRRG